MPTGVLMRTPALSEGLFMRRNRLSYEHANLAFVACALATFLGCAGHNGDDATSGSGTTGANTNVNGAGDTVGTTTTGGPSASSNPGEPPKFACDPAARAPVATLRRLTTTQYKNTLASLASWALADATMGTQMMSGMADVLRAMPEDQREAVPQDLHGSYRRLDQSLQQENVDGAYAAGIAFGNALAAHLGVVVGTCATDADASNDASCLDAFIQRFGARALRRPLDATEVAFYRSVYGANAAPDPQAYADVIGVMLNSPQFLYFVEHGSAEVAGMPGVYEVTPFELASRLSYQFWDTLPDDTLWQTASDGSLLQPDVYQREVDRLYADPRTRPTISGFVSDWLKTDDLPALDSHNQDAVFRAFAGTDLPGAGLRQQMIDDVLGLVDFYVWNKKGSLDDLLTTELSFARGADLAKLYGVAPWDGVSAPPSFPSGQRPGFLTRALFLASGSANTRPILKGVFIRRNMLCDEIPPPPPGANAVPPQLSPDMTTRQVVEQLTQKQGSVCAGCHTKVINPLGFATEDFDALGRFRTEQRLFDANGNEVGRKPVDTHSVPLVADGDTSASAGPADLTRLIVQSGKANACFARNYFRFTYARWEDLAADGCTLESLRKELDGGGRVGDLLKAVALSPAFRRRTFQ
jgi:hypothetical protein